MSNTIGKLRNLKDGLVNVVSGLGTNKSKRQHNQWEINAFNLWPQLEASYQSNWISRGIVDIPAQDMTREWRRIKSKDAESIEAVEKEILLQTAVQEAIQWARLYGGAGIVMCTGQDLGSPLRINQIKKGDLKRVLVFDRYDLVAHTINSTDVLAPNYLQAEYYSVRGGSQRIHWTHVARFNGEKLPLRLMAQTQGWGDSVLNKCIEDVGDMVAAKNGIAELMQEANIDILKREGLSEELASGEDDNIISRYELFSQMKSIINMGLLDGTETIERQTLNLSGVAPILDTFITWISGCAKIPVTKLFGTSATGMNATGEGDMKNYYDTIRADQTTGLVMPMRTIDEVLVRSATGTFPDDYDYVWNPLHQSNELEAAQGDLLRAQKNVVYLDSNLVKKSQIMRELQANEEYQFEDGEIEELEELEEADLFNDIPDIPKEKEGLELSEVE